MNKINSNPGKFTRFLRKLYWLFFVYLTPRHDHTIETENGLLSFDSKDRKLGRFLHIYREFEYQDIHKTVHWLREAGLLDKEADGTVLDVGGYIGMICIPMIRDKLFDRAIAFEPHPDNFRLLETNIKQNQLQDRITAHHCALSDNNGSLTFELSQENYGDHRVRSDTAQSSEQFNEHKRKTIDVPSNSLDSMIHDNKLATSADNIQMVWMDIQGHEGRFIKGAQNFFRTHAGIPVYMEFWPYAIIRSGMQAQEFCSLVSDLFTCFYTFESQPPQRHDISEMSRYFDMHEKANSGSHILLIREKI
jgi:FkbM family methyltransferase